MTRKHATLCCDTPSLLIDYRLGINEETSDTILRIERVTCGKCGGMYQFMDNEGDFVGFTDLDLYLDQRKAGK